METPEKTRKETLTTPNSVHKEDVSKPKRRTGQKLLQASLQAYELHLQHFTDPEIAEILKIPQITYAIKVEISENKKRIRVRRETDEGYEDIECRLPALLTATKGLNEPRLPSLMAIMAASKKEIKTITAEELGGDAEQYGLSGSPTQVVEVFTPEVRTGGIKIDGTEDPAGAAKQLVEWLLKKGAI